jgi:hypothetical protein
VSSNSSRLLCAWKSQAVELASLHSRRRVGLPLPRSAVALHYSRDGSDCPCILYESLRLFSRLERHDDLSVLSTNTSSYFFAAGKENPA